MPTAQTEAKLIKRFFEEEPNSRNFQFLVSFLLKRLALENAEDEQYVERVLREQLYFGLYHDENDENPHYNEESLHKLAAILAFLFTPSSIEQIGERRGITRTPFKKTLDKAAARIRSKHWSKHPLDAKKYELIATKLGGNLRTIALMCKDGLTFEQIASHTGIKPGRLQVLLFELETYGYSVPNQQS